METIVDFECVPSYSRKMFAQIISMEEILIVPAYSFKAGTFVFQIVISKCHWFIFHFHITLLYSKMKSIVKKMVIMFWRNITMVIFTFWETKRQNGKYNAWSVSLQQLKANHRIAIARLIFRIFGFLNSMKVVFEVVEISLWVEIVHYFLFKRLKIPYLIPKFNLEKYNYKVDKLK